MSSFGSPIHREISAVDEPPPEPIPTVDHEGEEVADEEDEEEFEFAFVSDSGAITADEIFSNGQIRPIYPVFNRDLLIPSDPTEPSKADPIETLRLPLRKLLIDDREPPSSSSSSEADDLDGVPAESYCVWTPSSVPPTPERCKKSNSTGSSRRWRFRDLVVGRSNSDGKEKFVFLSASSAAAQSKPPMKEEKKKAAVKGGGGNKKGKVAVTPEHRMQYGKGFQSGGGGGGDRRRTFLPYRPDLVGFFANVNGLSKTYQPF